MQTKAQTIPASVTVSGACLNSTYVLPKFADDYESTGKPAYLGTGSVTINTTAYQDVGMAVYYETSSPAGWVLALDGQPYLTVASNTALPPISGWQVVPDNSLGNCTGGVGLTVLTVPPSVSISPANPTAVCAGASVNLTATPTGIPATVTYAWSSSPAGFSGSSNTLTQNAPNVGTSTTYTISVTASNGGIRATSSVTLTVNPLPTLTQNGSANPTTCGGTNGIINFTTNLSNGTYQLSYTGAGSPKSVVVTGGAFSLTGLAAGSYSAFSITNNGCTGSLATPVTLNNPTPTLTVSGSGSPTTCGGTNGRLEFTTTNLANGTYTLSYTGPGSAATVTVAANSFTLTGLGQGTYTSFSLSGNGCTATSSSSVPLTDPAPPTLTLGTPANPTTCGGTNGSIGFTTNIASGTYQVSYTGTGSPKTVTIASNAFSLTGLSAGTYSNFSLTRFGCSVTVTTPVTLTDPPTPTLVLSTSANPSTCSGTNGSISFTTNLSNGTYQLNYTGAGNPKQVTVTGGAFSLTGLAAGSYSAFSITNNGCTGSLNTTIPLTDPVAPTLTQNGSTNPTTCGGTNGSISFTTNLSNGTYQLNYTGAGSPKTITVASGAFSLTGLAAGSYSAFSITNNGCTGSSNPSVTLTDPPTPTLVLSTSANPSTCSGTNGSISFTTNLPNGTYQLNYTGAGNPKQVTVTGGAFSLTGLAAGSYSAFSITNNACTGSLNTSVSLSDPATPTLAVSTTVSPSTCGGTNGSISFTTNLPNATYTLNYTGSGSPKQVTVTNGAFTLTGLAAGTYSAFSITNNGCVGSVNTSVTLNNPPTPTLVFSASANPSTCSGTNGSISFTTNLPNGTYQLSYTGAGNPKQVTVTSGAFSLTGLAAGAYSAFSITNNGCTGSLNTSVSLSDPATPTLAVSTTVSPSTCNGTNGSIAFTTTNLANGTYQLSYTGAGSPKQITVTNNAFTLTGLGAGTYSAFSITNNGCVGSANTSVTLNNPPTPTLVQNGSANPTTCSGTNGSISFTTNLPNGTYQLSYTGVGSPKQVTVTGGAFTLAGLAAGSYSAFSITNNGCTGSLNTSVSLSDPAAPALIPGTPTNPTTCGGTNGSIAFTTANLPNGTYTLNYTGAGSPKQITVTNNAFTLTGLGAGTYSAFSITNNGCVGSANTSVTLNNPPTPTLVQNGSANPTTCSGTNGSISFTTNLPNGTYQLSYTGVGSPKQVTVTGGAFTLAGLAAGSYSAFSITNNGCTGTLNTTVSLSDPTAPSVTLTSSGTITCSNPQVTLVATTGASSYLFSSGASQVGGSGGNTATVTNPGLYSVTYVSANNCRSTASVNVSSNSTLNAPTLQASAATTTAQPISVTATGCAGTINWNSQGGVGSANGSIYTYTQPGNYTLTATCTVGSCTSPSSNAVSPRILPGVFAITQVTTVNCQVLNATTGRYQITFNPIYSGQNSNPISFSVVNEMLPTTNSGPYTLQLYNDNSTINLVAVQAGNGQANFAYNWVAACQSGGTPNRPPTTTGIPNQTITQGQAYQLNLSPYFSDPDGQALTFTSQNLPAGLSINGTSISGAPSASGVSAVTITALDPAGLSASANFQLTVRPANTTPTGFAIASVSMVNCQVLKPDQRRITFNPQYAGLNGSPISFSVVNEMLPTNNPGPYSLDLYTDNPTITLVAKQGASVVTYPYNWFAACNAPARASVAEAGSKLSVKVLGNPVVGKSAEVEIQGVQGQSVQLDLVDLQGKSIHQQRIEQAAATERVNIPMNDNRGILLLNVSTNLQQQQVKLIRQ
ncbi:hypothetical protein GCM10028807_10290 [Spirosoma daeguense]